MLLTCHNHTVDSYVSCLFEILKQDEYEFNKELGLKNIPNGVKQCLNSQYL